MRINQNMQTNLLSNNLKIINSSNGIKNSANNKAVEVSISSSSLNKLENIENNHLFKNETIIKSHNNFNRYDNIKIKAREIRNEYYSKVVAKDRTFDNPTQHIKDKYYNQSSPYFISDLTKEERGSAYKNELGYLKYGGKAPIKYGDPILLKEIGYMHGGLDHALQKKFNREKVNEQFGQLLDRYNIKIPQDTKLTFTIDPYNYKAKVSGTNDTELKNSIEKALNTAENSTQLYAHIRNSSWEGNAQYSEEKALKASIYHDVKRETGYELDKLKVVNGKFVTEEGIDIFELTKKSIKEGTLVPKEFQSFVIADIYEKLENLAKVGFDAVPDYNLSIDFKNGSFYDVGQSKNFGVGQTQWLDEFEKKYSAQSYREGFRAKEDGNSSAVEFNKVEIIKESLKGILEKSSDNSIEDIESTTFDKDELILKYLFKTWEESTVEEFNDLLKELKKDKRFESIPLSFSDISKSSYVKEKTDFETISQSIDIYV